MSQHVATPAGRRILIHTDGSCINNPGPGGWAAILRSLDGDKILQERVLTGSDADTTNNRMEMTAVLRGLQAVKSTSPVTITTDSAYVTDGMTKWLVGWKAKGWVNSSKKPVVNRDLWEQLDELNLKMSVKWEWVRGHNGHPLNERADRLANRTARGL